MELRKAEIPEPKKRSWKKKRKYFKLIQDFRDSGMETVEIVRQDGDAMVNTIQTGLIRELRMLEEQDVALVRRGNRLFLKRKDMS